MEIAEEEALQHKMLVEEQLREAMILEHGHSRVQYLIMDKEHYQVFGHLVTQPLRHTQTTMPLLTVILQEVTQLS